MKILFLTFNNITMPDFGKCFFCKKEIDAKTFAIAAAYWGNMIYKIIQNKPMTKSEQQMMRTKAYLDRDKCVGCRRKIKNKRFPY